MANLNDYKLNSLRQEHSSLVWEWRNSSHIRPFMNHDRMIPLEDHCKWMDSTLQDTSKLVKLCLYQEKPVGLVNFTRLDRLNGTCEWGFYIGDQSCPRGSGKAMGILALDLIFQDEQMRKVSAQILEFNQKSLSYHQRLGFTEEGRLSKHIARPHRYADVVLMGLFREQWEERSRALKEEAADANE